MAQDSSAYKFSLFGSAVDYGSAVPELEPEFEPYKEHRKKPAQKPVKKRQAQPASKAQKIETRASIVKMLKVLVVVAFVFAMLCVPMYLNVKMDETSKNITSVQKDIDIAKSENVRLEATLKGMVSIDKIEDYAENNLGMVKLENYRITYFSTDDSDHVVISGGKSYRGSNG